MYTRDQTRVQRWVNSADRAHDLVTMVLLSYRMPWYTVGYQLADVRENGAKSKYIWGWKKDGYECSKAFKHEIWKTIQNLREGAIDEKRAMLELVWMPGLGMIKSGFILQLACGRVGCLDTHNIKRFGLSWKQFKLPKYRDAGKTVEERRKAIRNYVNTCERVGGTEYLWDSWCELIFERHPGKFESVDHVSRVHFEYLKGV